MTHTRDGQFQSLASFSEATHTHAFFGLGSGAIRSLVRTLRNRACSHLEPPWSRTRVRSHPQLPGRSRRMSGSDRALPNSDRRPRGWALQFLTGCRVTVAVIRSRRGRGPFPCLKAFTLTAGSQTRGGSCNAQLEPRDRNARLGRTRLEATPAKAGLDGITRLRRVTLVVARDVPGGGLVVVRESERHR